MKRFALVSLILASFAAQAAEQHPGDRFTHFAGFEFEDATLAEVQARIGPSQVHTRGDAAEAEAWVCYSQDGAEVQFKSGEMGGNTELLGVTLILHPPANHQCPIARSPLPLSLDGLKFGMSKQSFARAVSTPLSWSGQNATASFEHIESNPSNQKIYVYVTVIGTFKVNKLVKVVTWKTSELP